MQEVQRGQQAPAQGNGLLDVLTQGPLRVIVALIVPIIGFLLLYYSFIFMRDSEASKFLIGVVALVVGVFGVWFLYIATYNLIDLLPEGYRDGLRPYVFVGPAMAILTVFLIYPTFDTLWRSLQDENSEEFVGLANYEYIFTNAATLQTLGNNLLWIIFVTAGSVGVGLLLAVMFDRIGRAEPFAKALIFLPMAISAVGASVIWKFMYDNQPTPPQIGLLNALRTESLGAENGINFIREQPINNFALMFIMFWMITGFCMVILSSAVKGVPSELLEAGRIDGANEFRIFFSIIIPVIGPTILTVTTTVLIMVLKVFDIIYVFGAQRYGADVIANRMFFELFRFRNYGLGSALAAILLLAVLPLIIWNIYQLRKQQRR